MKFLSDVIEDATMYLAVHFLSPRKDIQINNFHFQIPEQYVS